jgi:hypothetical protein
MLLTASFRSIPFHSIVGSEKDCGDPRAWATAKSTSSTATNMQAMHMEKMFSMLSVPRLYNYSPFAAFNIPYVYDYITKLCRQQAEVILNHDNENVRNIGQGEARHRKYKRLKLGGGQAYDRSSV